MAQARRDGWFVKIIATPQGIAPEEIRRAWVGLVLPVVGREDGEMIAARKLQGFLSDTAGYVVSGPQALELLKEHRGNAWIWWVANFPRLCEGGVLAFEETVCEEVSG